jgi:hypothetical protein
MGLRFRAGGEIVRVDNGDEGGGCNTPGVSHWLDDELGPN